MPRPGLYRREGELAGLLAATRAMGSRVLLRGEHGSGKTSLLAEVRCAVPPFLFDRSPSLHRLSPIFHRLLTAFP